MKKSNKPASKPKGYIRIIGFNMKVYVIPIGQCTDIQLMYLNNPKKSLTNQNERN